MRALTNEARLLEARRRTETMAAPLPAALVVSPSTWWKKAPSIGLVTRRWRRWGCPPTARSPARTRNAADRRAPHTERALALRCLLAGWTAPVEGEEVARTTTAERNRLEKVASKKKSEQARL